MSIVRAGNVFLYMYIAVFQIFFIHGIPEIRQMRARELFDLQSQYPSSYFPFLTVGSVKSRIYCCSFCLQNDSCKSFFYNHQQYNCHIFDKEFTISDVTSASGWIYYTAEKDTTEEASTICPPNSGYVLKTEYSICYKIYNVPVYTTPSALMNSCQNEGAELLKITSQSMQDFFASELVDIGGSYGYALIQGNDNAVENVWKFDDGTVLTYYNWNTPQGQPTVSTAENVIGMSQNYNYKWHDLDASSSYFLIYICQIQ